MICAYGLWENKKLAGSNLQAILKMVRAKGLEPPRR